uniref:RING-type domain-containing protein n=1 Tax=Glycine max TaxID=3847 RepID=A0A368UJG3_SOYBN
MAIRGVNFKWFDGFFLSMLATSIAIVAINWKRYQSCTHPLHIWTVVDYAAVFTFRLLMFVDNGLASGMGLDFGWPQRYARFCGRVVVLSILALLLYPFLWAWTIIGTLWFSNTKICLPGGGQKWGFLIWLLFSYCGLLCIACLAMRKWLKRRQARMLGAQEGIPVSAFGREAVEALIQELPSFRLTAVPTNCSECLICLEEFHVGNQVRGLPCAHNFHVECIDEWLRLNVNCPRCRCSVFPNLDLSALSNIRSESEQSSATAVTSRDMTGQTSSQSYLLRLQGPLHPVCVDFAGPAGETDNALENAENGVVPVVTQNMSTRDQATSGEHMPVGLSSSQN